MTNDQKPEKRPWDYQSFLLSIATAGTIACFGFLWKMNIAVTLLNDHDTKRTIEEDRMQSTINKMQSDIQWLREQAIRNERTEKSASITQSN